MAKRRQAEIGDTIPGPGVSPYGNCPVCGAMGRERERRPGGNDRCENGHEYPSKDAIVIGGGGGDDSAAESPVEWPGVWDSPADGSLDGPDDIASPPEVVRQSRWEVALDRAPTMIVEADSSEEAWEQYKAFQGITATRHMPRITQVQ